VTTPREIAIVALLAGGVFFVFVGAVGIIRLPDLYTRTHAASKSDTLGVVLSLAAATLIFENFSMQLKVFALLLFMLVTTPTATHAIARAAFDQGVTPWTLDEEGDSSQTDGAFDDISTPDETRDRGGVTDQNDPRSADGGGD
jgi:multicomponent Na+:H+ antiporter subunit G